MAGAGPAVFFWNGDTDQPEFGEGLPERPVVLAALFHHVARATAAMLLQEPSRLVAQLLLFRREVKIHDRPCVSLRACGSAACQCAVRQSHCGMLVNRLINAAMTEITEEMHDAPGAAGGGVKTRSATKNRLIAAAREIMIERNAVDFSLQDVAARSSLNSALVKYHFGNKDGLLLAILEQDAGQAVAQMRRLASLDISATAKLEAHVKGVIETYYRYPYLNRLVHLMMHERGESSAEQVARFFVTPLAAFQRNLLDAGVASGEFKRVDPIFFYHAVIGACEHLFSSRLSMARVFGAEPINDDLCRRYTAHVVDLVGRGLLRHAG